MRLTHRHWGVALAGSLAIHFALSLAIGKSPPEIEIERSAGNPITVSAANVMAAFDAAPTETGPVKTEKHAKVTEPDHAAPVLPDTPIIAAGPQEVTSAVPSQSAKARSPAQVRAQPITVSQIATTGVAALAKATRPQTLPDTSSPISVQTAQSANPSRPSPSHEKVTSPDPKTATRAEPASDTIKAALTAQPSPPTARKSITKPENAKPVQPRQHVSEIPNNKGATPTTRLVVAAVDPSVAVTKTETPKQVKRAKAPPAKNSPASPKTTKKPTNSQKRQARDEKRTQGQTRNSRASQRQSGSSAKGKTARRAGDGGRRKSVSGKASRSNYLGKVISRLHRQKRYPSDAKKRGVQGTAVVAFTINPNGSVSGIRLSRSAGSASLDKAVLAMVRRASPFPPIPSGLGRKRIPISVPVRFRVR